MEETITLEHAELPWLVKSDKYPPTVKRILLVGRRGGNDYVIAAESMKVRHVDAKRDYAFICEAVNSYDSLRSRCAELEAAAREVVKGVDDWNTDVQKIIGRVPDYKWGNLERLRAALEQSDKSGGE